MCGHVRFVPAHTLVKLTVVELIFTSLLVIMAVAVLWFAGYVIYRLYSDQR